MFDKDAPSTQAALAAYEDVALRRKVLRYAIWRTQDEDKAKDLVADALVRTCDPQGRPWDPDRGSLFRHMRRVMDDLAVEAHRTGFGRFEVVDGDHAAFDSAAQPGLLPDEEVHAHRKLGWLTGMMHTVLERVGVRDPLPHRIWKLAKDQALAEPAEFAEALNEPIEHIYEAMRRLRYHAAPVRTEWEQAESKRVTDLQRRSVRAMKVKPS